MVSGTCDFCTLGATRGQPLRKSVVDSTITSHEKCDELYQGDHRVTKMAQERAKDSNPYPTHTITCSCGNEYTSRMNPESRKVRDRPRCGKCSKRA